MTAPDNDDAPLSPVVVALRRVVATLPRGGEARSGQELMADAVDEAFAEHRHLIVQAGTGTGKSLAYLVPAALTDRPVLVATATKALQEQLASRDLPVVRDALDDSLSVAVLKGRANYLCRQRTAELRERGFQSALDVDSSPESTPKSDRVVAQVERLLSWERRTATGDRSALDEDVSDQAWAMVTTGPRECPGAFSCPQGHHCFAEAARSAAQEADVIVVNLHLLGSHLASDGQVLPDFDAVIIDEAHELEGVMTQCLGVTLGPGRLRSVATAARQVLNGAALDAPGTLRDIADGLATVLAGTPDSAAIDLGQHEDLATTLRQADDATRAVLSRLREVDADAEPGATRTISAATRLLDELARIQAPTLDEVLWIEGTGSARAVTLSPIDVGPLLSGRLFDDATVVMTSATIPPRMAQRLRLEGDVTELDVGSPFDFRSHSILYVASHLVDRRAEEAEAQIADEISALIEAAGGRTLALFTSRRALQEISDRVADQITHPILVQGAAPNQSLINRFRDEEDACLFATMGMWQGLDVPGRSLSLVTIDRLPFGRPDDPVLEARRSRAGSQAFSLVDLPRAATLLAQGVGRLIRTTTDEGVVAVLDPRLATATYRSVLLNALPPMRRSIDRQEVLAFLESIAASELGDEKGQK